MFFFKNKFQFFNGRKGGGAGRTGERSYGKNYMGNLGGEETREFIRLDGGKGGGVKYRRKGRGEEEEEKRYVTRRCKNGKI